MLLISLIILFVQYQKFQKVKLLSSSQLDKQAKSSLSKQSLSKNVEFLTFASPKLVSSNCALIVLGNLQEQSQGCISQVDHS